MVCSYLSHQWRHSKRHWEILDKPPSINFVRRVTVNWRSTTCTLRKLQLTSGGEHEQSTDGGETSRWRNVLGAKIPGGETSRGRNVLWRGETGPGGETSINRQINDTFRLETSSCDTVFCNYISTEYGTLNLTLNCSRGVNVNLKTLLCCIIQCSAITTISQLPTKFINFLQKPLNTLRAPYCFDRWILNQNHIFLWNFHDFV